MSTLYEWTESSEHPGYRIKVIKKNGCTIQILRPLLNDAEKSKRETQLITVAERVLSNIYTRKERSS